MQKIFPSKFNGPIKVKKYLWETSVWVGGFQQSGPLVEDVWQKALKAINFTPKDILILGFGCGSAAKVISGKFPAAKITGVEIDLTILEIGRKYFPQNFSKIKVVCADARDFLKKNQDFLRKNKKKFDLIILDVYLGEKKVLIEKKLTAIGKVVMENHLEKNKWGYWVNQVKILPAIS